MKATPRFKEEFLQRLHIVLEQGQCQEVNLRRAIRRLFTSVPPLTEKPKVIIWANEHSASPEGYLVCLTKLINELPIFSKVIHLCAEEQNFTFCLTGDLSGLKNWEIDYAFRVLREILEEGAMGTYDEFFPPWIQHFTGAQFEKFDAQMHLKITEIQDEIFKWLHFHSKD